MDVKNVELVVGGNDMEGDVEPDDDVVEIDTELKTELADDDVGLDEPLAVPDGAPVTGHADYSLDQ